MIQRVAEYILGPGLTAAVGGILACVAAIAITLGGLSAVVFLFQYFEKRAAK